jgi:hypothetical protein
MSPTPRVAMKELIRSLVMRSPFTSPTPAPMMSTSPTPRAIRAGSPCMMTPDRTAATLIR